MQLTLYFDGACEPTNPGGVATWGWVLFGVHGDRMAAECGVAAKGGDNATNNVAEYHALGRGLRYLREVLVLVEDLGIDPTQVAILVRGDSQLVINQMIGQWNCNKSHLAGLRKRCLDLTNQLSGAGFEVRFEWIPRDSNTDADAMSRRAWEQATKKKFPERSRK